jgi:transcriptional accessory protein Tex/SPT6
MGLDPGHAHRRQGGGGRPHRQGAGHRHHLPARAAPRLGRRPGTLALLARKHGVELISIGNGTASRETDKLAAELIKRSRPELAPDQVVTEAGASVYSASEYAWRREFPELDVSLRGAVSIARRLQDPLAELVKIDPKAIGVGQYQHDVNQTKLARRWMRWSRTASTPSAWT